MPFCELENNTFVYYRSYGEGKPFISIHGFSVDHRIMMGCLEPIFAKRRGWRRIYLDLPGHGRTLATLQVMSSDQMLKLIINFVNKIIPNQPIVLAGESYGGYLVQGMVHELPKIIDGILLICPMIIARFSERTLPKHQILSKDEDFFTKQKTKDIKKYFYPIHVVQNQKTWKRFNKEVLVGLKNSDGDYLAELKKNYAFSFDSMMLPKNFNKPALMITGKQDSFTGYHDAWAILKNYSRMTFAVIDKAGHNLQIEQPKLFNALVTEWLDHLEHES